MRRTLIFDADDTLWENNVLFERVVDDFIEWLAHPTLDAEAIRGVLLDIERANIVVHGYGARAFLRNLAECFAVLAARPVSASDEQAIEALAVALLDHRVELMPGVSDVLADLSTRHDLLMLTKGDPEEQTRKIEVSGLAPYFGGLHIVAEKNEAIYRELVESVSLVPETSVMIGNSPRSDILPALAVGMAAVHIPHPSTWALELAELDPTTPRLLTLRSLRELPQHF